MVVLLPFDRYTPELTSYNPSQITNTIRACD